MHPGSLVAAHVRVLDADASVHGNGQDAGDKLPVVDVGQDDLLSVWDVSAGVSIRDFFIMGVLRRSALREGHGVRLSPVG